MDEIVRVGIAGLGRSGWNIHALTLESLPEMYQVVAGCDLDPERRQEMCARFGCQVYSDFIELLQDEDVELVVVAVPSHQHCQYAVQAMQAGKTVVIEKPMATSLEEVDHMLAAARQTGQLMTVYQNYRFSADFMKIRDVIESGKLGRIVLVRIARHGFYRRWDWQTLKEFGGGQLNIAGSHLVDQALFFLPDQELQVFCQIETTPLWSGDADGHVKIVLNGEAGPAVDIEITCTCAYPQPTWLVMGTLGSLSGTATSLKWKYIRPEDLVPRQVVREAAPDRKYYNFETLPWHEETCDLSGDQAGEDKRFYRELYNTLRLQAPLAVTPESVRREIMVLDRCRQLSST